MVVEAVRRKSAGVYSEMGLGLLKNLGVVLVKIPASPDYFGRLCTKIDERKFGP